MVTDILDLLKKLDIEERGSYVDDFYVIKLKNSDDYGRMYGKLDALTTNLGDPSIGTNTNDSTVNVVTYFETEINDIAYELFLEADFAEDSYELRLTEKGNG